MPFGRIPDGLVDRLEKLGVVVTVSRNGGGWVVRVRRA
jgi:hypothetical protein